MKKGIKKVEKSTSQKILLSCVMYVKSNEKKILFWILSNIIVC